MSKDDKDNKAQMYCAVITHREEQQMRHLLENNLQNKDLLLQITISRFVN